MNPAPYNPRVALKPGDEEFEDIKASIQRHGLVQPYVWNSATGHLVSGHQRMAVERHLGRHEGPCFVVTIEQPHEEKALNIALNAIKGKWDRPKLQDLLLDLKRAEFDLSRLGFRRPELRNLLKRATIPTQRDPEYIPPTPLKPVTKPGDVIEMKAAASDVEHRLVCGDSTKPETLAALMENRTARLVLTDPPYGVSYLPRTNGKKAPRKKIQNDELTGTNLTRFLESIFRNAHRHAKPQAAMICFYASRHHIEFETALQQAGWTTLQQLIWIKESLVLGWRGFHWIHEPIFYAARESLTTEWFGDRTATTLLLDDERPVDKLTREEMEAAITEMREQATCWRIPRDFGQNPLHTTQKPVEAGRRPMRLLTMPQDTVLETCGGSGFVAIAGELEQRNTATVELDPGNCDVITQRFKSVFLDVTITRNGEPE